MNETGSIRALTVNEIIVEGWKQFRTNARAILPLVLLISVPLEMVSWQFHDFTVVDQQNLPLLLRYLLLALFMWFVFGTLLQLSLIRMVESSMLGSPITLPEALRHAFSRWMPALGTGLLSLLIVAAWSLLLFVPGFIWSVYYTFGLMVVALRGVSGKAALDRSKAMVRGRWWRVLGYQVVFFLFPAVVSTAMKPLYELAPDSIVMLVTLDLIYRLMYLIAVSMSTVFFINLEASGGDGAARQDA